MDGLKTGNETKLFPKGKNEGWFLIGKSMYLENLLLQQMTIMTRTIKFMHSKILKEMQKESLFGKMVLVMKGSL